MDNRKLLLWMGFVSTTMLILQCVECPYLNSNVTQSVGSFYSGQSHNNSNEPGKFSVNAGFNMSEANVLESPNMTLTFEGMHISTKNDFVNARSESSATSLKSDEDLEPEKESYSEIPELYENSTLVNVEHHKNLEPANASKSGYGFLAENATAKNILASKKWEQYIVLGRGRNRRLNVSSLTPSLRWQQTKGTPPFMSLTNVDAKSGSMQISLSPSPPLPDKGADCMLKKKRTSRPLLDIHVPPVSKSFVANVPIMKDTFKKSKAVVSISNMSDMLLQSHTSFRSPKPKWSSSVDQELLHAKFLIESETSVENYDNLYAPVYRNLSMFLRSYNMMERILKVYIYAEGRKPIFHQPLLRGIYASEGWFMKLLKENKKFVTKQSRKAHLFYLPFCSKILKEVLHIPNSQNRTNLIQCLEDYVGTIARKYPFWNRTGGADHFLVSCHDWAPSLTNVTMAKSIRSLCNSDIRLGFTFGKDAALPETRIRDFRNPLLDLGGKPPSQRQFLTFFAGNMHGSLRPILLNHWENKDPDMKIFGLLRNIKGHMSYEQYMKSSKYCICAKGTGVSSPRVVEAIFYECVPVIISDRYVPPFFEVLNWESFAVFVFQKDIPKLKNILLSIPEKKYLEMYHGVKQVQQHFLWHPKPVKYDIFHMILHSIWYNRVFYM